MNNLYLTHHFNLIHCRFFLLTLLLYGMTYTIKAQNTFDQRAEAIINEYAVATVPGDIPKYGFWYAQANFVKDQDDQGRDVLTQTLNNVPADPPFAYWGCMDAYMRWNDTRYTDELRDLTKNFMTSFTGYDEGTTQNHGIMLAAARFLASEQWPSSDFVSGSEFAPDDPTGKKYLLFRLTEWIHRGVIEHDSPIYIAFHIGPMRLLADYALDPEVRQLASLAFEWLMINSANEWMEGHYATSSLRNLFPYDAQNEYYESDMTLWLYFGGKTPDNFNLGSLPRACFAVGSAVSDYSLPDIIHDLANKRDQPFVNLESHAVNTEWRLDFRKTTFMDGNRYALYSQAELPTGQNAGLNTQSHRWGIVWESVNGDNLKSAFWIKHGRRDISRNRAGTTKYEQVVQKDRTLAAIYDIPADEDFPFAEGFVSDDFSAYIDTPNKIYFHYGNVLIAILSPKELLWNEGDARIRSDHLKNGLAIETASPDRYAGDPMTQLAAFKSEIESIDRLKGSDVDSQTPALMYRSIYDHTLDIAYNVHRKIDGNAVDYTSWPLMSNPWVQQDIEANTLIVNIDGIQRTYDFGNLTVTEGQGELLPVPRDFRGEAESSSKVALSWIDLDNETGYEIQRKEEGTEFATVTLPGPDVVNYADTALNPNTIYSYRIRALGSISNSFFSDPVFITTLKLPPAAPDSLTAEQTFFDRIDLTWIDRSDTEEGTLIQRKHEVDSFLIIATLPPGITEFTDSTLQESGFYEYRVVAFNNGGENSSAGTGILYERKIRKLILHSSCSQDPSYERRWRVYNPNSFKVRFNWKSFGLQTTQSGALIAPPGDSYFFSNTVSLINIAKIFWRDERGRPHLRIRLSRGEQCNLPVPATPEEVTITAAGISVIQLNWNDVAENEDSYEIERLEGDQFVLVGFTEQNTQSFQDEELMEGETYTYRIRAFNNTYGHSPYSGTSTGSTALAIAHYKLNGNVLDENNVNDAVNNGASFVLGKFGDAARFEGTDDFIAIPSGILGSARGAVTVWFRTTQASRGMIFYGSEENVGNGFGPDKETHLNINNDGELEFFNQGANETQINGGKVNDDNWHMAVASWDVSGRIDLYVDGELKRSASHGGGPFDFLANIYLGRPSDDRRYFQGDLDEVKLYNVPLTAFDVGNMFEDHLANSQFTAKSGSTSSEIATSTIENFSEKNSFRAISLYPNPANNLMNIWLPETGIWHMRITDITGKRDLLKETYSAERKGEVVQSNVNKLTKGLYLVHLTRDKKHHTIKLIIEN